LVSRQGRWLVTRRSEGRVFGGYWEFPGGGIEGGESAFEAAVRETREEAGLVVEPVETLGRVQTSHGGQRVTLHLIRCRPVAGEPRPASPAVADVRWVSLAELRQLPMPPANDEIRRRIALLPGS